MKTLKKWQGLSLRVFVGAPNKTPQQTLRATLYFLQPFKRYSLRVSDLLTNL